ncbi:MAG: C4-dicarboxylate ABC transporter substrate-binding protein [Gammaproteobacteria bacterium]|nr:MAG: C4-dicarboxylate ABC transporter substrate-binding protein [Gammaproteobacteria bacterium]
MNHIKFLFAGIFLSLASFSALGEEFTLSIQTLDPESSPNFTFQKSWVDDIHKRSQGRLKINLLPVGSVCKHTETIDAIQSNKIDGHFSAEVYFVSKDPAFGLIGDLVGAWSDASQLLDYMNNGGGNALLTEMYEKYHIHMVGVATTGVESLVSRRPVNGVADLKGFKMRAPEGLVRQVFAAAGAIPVNLPFSKVKQGLKNKVLDGADYSVFSTNQKIGLNDLAHHPMYPGFHSIPLLDFSISEKKWQQLPPELQQVLIDATNDYAVSVTNKFKVLDEKVVKQVLQNDPQIKIHNWSEAERKKFRAIAQTQWKIYAKRSPMAKKVYNSVTTYLKNQNLL